MGLFSKKPADSKARIEELKKKIQAEQATYAAAPAQPIAPPAPPMPPQAPPAAPAPVPQAPPAPQPMQQAPPMPPQPQYQQPIYQQPAPQPVYAQQYEEPRHRRTDLIEELFEEEPMDEIKTGIILDLGEGMSLNLPIRSKMRLDEFLHIADKVRELQRLQR